MKHSVSSALRGLVLLAAGAFLAPGSLFAVQHEVRILMDLDNDVATGCTVATVGGPFDGVEQILITTVDTTSPPPAGTVTDVATSDCINPATDTFGPPASFDGGWPIGIDNGEGGLDVVETYFPLLASVVPDPKIIRVAVVVTDELGGEQALLTEDGTPDGEPILVNLQSLLEIPTLGEWGLILLALLLAGSSIVLLGRRGAVAAAAALLLLGGGLAWAAPGLDGLIDDWFLQDRVAGNGIVLWAKKVSNNLCFRVDVELLFNTSPTADPQAVTTDEDTSVAITLTGSDPESDPLTFTIVPGSGPANGTLTGAPPNVTYDPDPDYTGPDSFDFQVEDPSGATDTATVSITVDPVNDPPVVDAATFSVAEDAAVGTSVGTATFTDPDAGQSHTFAISAGNTGGAFAINATTGEITTAAALDFETLDTYALTVEVTDDGAPVLSGSNTVTVNVTDVDDAPVAVDDAATVTEDDPATAIDVLANDTDTDGGPKAIASASDPANGTVVLTGGSPGAHTGLTYEPDPDYCNDPPGTTPDSFSYTLTPGGDTATVSVTVTCVNDDPVAVDDAATVAEDSGATTIDVQANDTDADGDTNTITAVQNPSTAGGTVLITNAGADLSYEPAADYCNDPPGTTLDTFTYTLSPGGSMATVTVTVTCEDDPPVAVDDAATVAEDSGANAIDVLTNDTDIDAGPKNIAAASDPTNGTVVLTGGSPGAHTGLTYAPDANYCNNPPGTTLDTFTYTLNGGSTANVTVTVTCADDPPLAVNDTATVAEDSGANTIDVRLNDTDIDGGPMTVTLVQNPSTAGGTVLITNSGDDVSYAPAPDYCNDPPGTALDTFTYTLNGGSTATVTVTVTCLNDAPVLDLDADDDKGTGGANFAVAYSEGDGAELLEDPDDPLGATITDVDSTTLVSLTVTLTNLLDAGEELLDADVSAFSPDIDKDYDTTTPGVGVLTISSVTPQPIADYVAILRTVTYEHTGDDPDDSTARVVQFVANDGTNDSNTATSTVTLTAVDDDPVAVDDAATVAEDSGANAIDVLANDTDVDGGTKLVDTVQNPSANGGTVLVTGGGTGVTYAPAADYCNDPPGTSLDTFTYTLTPGGDTATVTVTVTCTDDDPVAVDDAATVTEDSGANAIDVLANDTDVDGGTKLVDTVQNPSANGGTVLVTGGGTGVTYAPAANYCNDPPGTTLDTFTYTLTPGGDTATVTVTVTCVDDDPVAVDDAATVTEDSGANAIDVLANDTDVDGGTKLVNSVQSPSVNGGTVLITGGGTGVTYAPAADYCNNPPGTTLDTFTYTLTPGGDTATVTVTVTCVDDPPVAVADAATVLEDSGANAIDVLANDTDIDAGPKTVNAVQSPSTAGGTVLITGGGTGVTYSPALNYCNDPPGTTLDTFTYTLNGGSMTTVTVTVTCVNDPPVAGADAFDFIGNTELRVDTGASATPHALETTGSGFGVLDNDADPVEGDSFAVTSITVGACTDSTGPTFDCTDAAVGTVHMQPDGSFSFEPAAGDAGASESFTYTVTDDGTPAPASAVGTVTLNRVRRVWYVDNSEGIDGTGTSTSPFNAIDADLNGAGGAGDLDSAGDYIFVHFGNGTDSGQSAGLELEGSQHLIGEFSGLSIPENLNGNGAPTILVAQPGPTDCAGGPCRPHLSNTAGNAVTVTEAMPGDLRGMRLEGGTGGDAIDITTDAVRGGNTTFNITDNVIVGAPVHGIDVNMLAGTSGPAIGLILNILNNSWDVSGTHTGNAVDISRAADLLTLDFSGNTGILSSGTGVNIASTTVAGVVIAGFSGNSVHGNTAGSGITMSNVSFDVLPFTGGFQQVDGDNLAIGASGNPVGGAGMVLTTVQGNLFFDDLDIYAAVGTGLQVTGAGGGMTFAVTPASPDGSGTSVIDADSGAAVSITSATIDLRLDDLESNTSGSGVSLSSVAGQFRAPSGSAITKSSGGGTAFSVGSSSATVNYGGTLNVTSGSGVGLTSNTGAANFTGQLTLNTGANSAFSATGGGTVTATDTTSTLTTTSGTPLTVTTTNIGSSGLRFASITSNGAVNGVLLNGNTGSTGRLVVGPAVGGACNSVATCAGGAIQNSTGAAISLTNTRNVSFTEMYILNGATHGIFGTTMADASGGAQPTFELKNSFLESPGDGDNESALYFDSAGVANITGRMVVSDTTIQNFEDVGVHVGNNSGTVTIELTDLTINNNSDTNGEEGVDVEALGTANITLDVSGGTFTDLEGGGFNVFISGGSGVIDLNIDGTTITGTGGPDNFPTPPAMTFSAEGGSSTLTFDITNNDILDSSGDGIFIGHEGTIMGRITGNDVSGMATGDGLRIDTDTSGSNTVTILVDGNNFGNVAGNTGIGDDGIQVLHRDGTKVLNLTITNNQIKNSNSEGIRYFADDDVAGGGPGNVVRISDNQFGSNGLVDLSDSIVMISQDSGTDVCANITGNTTVEGITLQQSLSAVLQITQASTAALSTANGGATVTTSGTITFNGTCITPPQPTN